LANISPEISPRPSGKHGDIALDMTEEDTTEDGKTDECKVEDICGKTEVAKKPGGKKKLRKKKKVARKRRDTAGMRVLVVRVLALPSSPCSAL
jgi:hypothetical protein